MGDLEGTSHAELLAVLRAIVEAKFHGNPCDLDVPGSAVLARFAIRVRDAVVAEESRRHPEAGAAHWRKWTRIGPEREEWGAARTYAVAMWQSCWDTWSPEERRTAAAALLAPYEAGEDGLGRFLTEVGSALSRRPT
jgi:hypothetical protein